MRCFSQPIGGNPINPDCFCVYLDWRPFAVGWCLNSDRVSRKLHE